MRLISKAYSSLNLTTMATMSGMSLDEARQAATDRGWTVDGTIVQPRKQIDEEQYSQSDKICLTEEQLQKLTQFVSFLENWGSFAVSRSSTCEFGLPRGFYMTDLKLLSQSHVVILLYKGGSARQRYIIDVRVRKISIPRERKGEGERERERKREGGKW